MWVPMASRHFNTTRRTNDGFSLAELLVTLAIVALLAGLAIPAYSTYIKSAKLKEPPALLTHTAAQLEKTFLDFRSYARCDDGASGDACKCNVTPASTASFAVNCKMRGDGYLLTASNVTLFGLGDGGSYVYTLDHLGRRATTYFAGKEIADTPCWVITEGTKC